MPGGDRTGPAGAGPMTGRGMGYCSGSTVPGYANAGPGMGRGYGRGMGRGFGGRGMAWRNGWNGRGWQGTVPVYAPVPPVYPQPAPDPRLELDALKRQVAAMEQDLAAARARVAAMEQEPDEPEK